MADEKISQLADGSAPTDSDEFPIARSGSNFSLTWAELKAAIPVGGGDTLHTVASSGPALTVNFATANVWDITLTANCTITLAGATNAQPDTLTLFLRQDASGSRTVVWPTVTWLSGAVPVLHTAPSSVDTLTLFSDDGGATWIGAQAVPQYPTGYEFGYDQVAAGATISSSTESSGTTVISCSAHTFDGGPVMAEFYCPFVHPAIASGALIIVSLFEGSTQLGRFGVVENDGSVGAGGVGAPLSGRFRFTPSVGPHTYTVTAFQSGGSGNLNCGTGGTGNYMPMYVRFTKA